MQLLIDDKALREKLGQNAENISNTNNIEFIGNHFLNFILEKV
jgi:hypothetical protein